MIEYPKFGLRFCTLYPETSNTRVKQKKIFEPPGVTIVTYPEQSEEKLNDIIASLENLKLGFKRTKNLHFTLL
jgi:hypothetical protein